MSERDPTVALRQIIEEIVLSELRLEHGHVGPIEPIAREVARGVLQRLADLNIEVVKR